MTTMEPSVIWTWTVKVAKHFCGFYFGWLDAGLYPPLVSGALRLLFRHFRSATKFYSRSNRSSCWFQTAALNPTSRRTRPATFWSLRKCRCISLPEATPHCPQTGHPTTTSHQPLIWPCCSPLQDSLPIVRQQLQSHRTHPSPPPLLFANRRQLWRHLRPPEPLWMQYLIRSGVLWPNFSDSYKSECVPVAQTPSTTLFVLGLLLRVTARSSSIRPPPQISSTIARPLTKRPSLSRQTSYTPKGICQITNRLYSSLAVRFSSACNH